MINSSRKIFMELVRRQNIRNMCIHGNTLIPTSKFGNSKTVEELYHVNKKGEDIGKIWSYNISEYKYELVDFDIIKTQEKKKMINIILEDETSLKCTSDQKILNNTTKKYTKANKMLHKMTTPFLRQFKVPNWCPCKNVRNENILIVDNKKKDKEKYDAYKIITKENDNFAIITEKIKNVECGIILSNKS